MIPDVWTIPTVLPLIWAAIAAAGVFMYVLMDGFDLGVGILFPWAHGEEDRDLMMNSVAPIWDGNETWLVLGGVVLLAVFPVAFSIIVPALYLPITFMVMGLIFRGVAFEFRFKAHTSKWLWTVAFAGGSLLATFFQGVVLGTFVQGFPVSGTQYTGGAFHWISPFSLMTGVALVLGYGLLGAAWLVMKTEGTLQGWARDATLVMHSDGLQTSWKLDRYPGLVLHDGVPVGTWRARKQGRRLAFEAEWFGEAVDIRAEAERLAELRGAAYEAA